MAGESQHHILATATILTDVDAEAIASGETGDFADFVGTTADFADWAMRLVRSLEGEDARVIFMVFMDPERQIGEES